MSNVASPSHSFLVLLMTVCSLCIQDMIDACVADCIDANQVSGTKRGALRFGFAGWIERSDTHQLG
jgi:hypothetical protein